MTVTIRIFSQVHTKTWGSTMCKRKWMAGSATGTAGDTETNALTPCLRWACLNYFPLVVFLQGNHSGCVKPPIDIKTKVVFYYEAHKLKRNLVLVSVGGWEHQRGLIVTFKNLACHLQGEPSFLWLHIVDLHSGVSPMTFLAYLKLLWQN